MPTKHEKSELEVVLRKVTNKFPKIRANPDLKFVQEMNFLMAHLKRNPSLRDCTLDSLQDALLQSASFGLSLNPVMSQCYLIPRRLQRGNNNSPMIAYASPGYRGLLDRATDSGAILWPKTDVVYQKDIFRVRGTSQEPLHDFDVMKPRGQIVGAYVYVKTLDGAYLTEWMGVDEIEAARKCSEAPNSLMYKSFYPEACKKIVIRRAWKRWPRKAQEFLMPLIEQLNTYEGFVDDQGVAQVMINNDQVNQLHAMLTDGGLLPEIADRWLHRAAQTQGALKIEELPVAKFNDVETLLAEKLPVA